MTVKKKRRKSKRNSSRKSRQYTSSNCPGNHGLKAFATLKNGLGCNKCDNNFIKGTVMYVCRKCNFDLCLNCYRNVKNQSKRCAVQTAYNEILKLFQEFKIHHVKEVSGTRIIRICCRSFAQLKDIPCAMKIIFPKKLVAEIGMPLKYEYKFKTMVMHLKLIDGSSKNEIYDFFTRRSCDYFLTLVNSPETQMAANSPCQM